MKMKAMSRPVTAFVLKKEQDEAESVEYNVLVAALSQIRDGMPCHENVLSQVP